MLPTWLLLCWMVLCEQEQVQWGDLGRYCHELEHYWLHREMGPVAAAVRAGLHTQLPAACVALLRWEELEEMVCGRPDIDGKCSATKATIVILTKCMRCES